MRGSAVVVLALGALASAQTYEGFPTSLSCKLTSGGTAEISKIEAQDTIVGPKGSKIDDSAANVASGFCVSLSGIPLYAVSWDPCRRFRQVRKTWGFCMLTASCLPGRPMFPTREPFTSHSTRRRTHTTSAPRREPSIRPAIPLHAQQHIKSGSFGNGHRRTRRGFDGFLEKDKQYSV